MQPEAENQTQAREMSSEQVVRVLGPERAMMRSPHGAGMFTKGSANIDSRLAQGWVVIASDGRNHLLRDVDQYDLVDNVPVLVHKAGQGSKEIAVSNGWEKGPFEHDQVQEPQSAAVQGNRRKRRSQRH